MQPLNMASGMILIMSFFSLVFLTWFLAGLLMETRIQSRKAVKNIPSKTPEQELAQQLHIRVELGCLPPRELNRRSA
jgi:hypothetical protein